MKSLASTINPELKKAVDGGTFVAIFEFKGVSNFASTPPFTLGGLTGSPSVAGGSSYLVDPVSYDSTCQNLNRFASSIVQGKLSGTATAISVLPSIGLGTSTTGMGFPMNLQDVVVSATVTGSDGSMTNGVLSGIWTKEEVDSQIAQLEAECAVTTTDICSYLGTAKAFLPMLFDLDLNKDGKKDASSVCMRFTTGPATIAGMETK